MRWQMPNDQVRYSCDKQPVRHSLGTNLRSIILTEMLRESFSTPHARMVCMSHGRRPLLQPSFFKKFLTRQDRRSRRFRVLFPSLTLRVGIWLCKAEKRYSIACAVKQKGTRCSRVETRTPGAGCIEMSLSKTPKTAANANSAHVFRIGAEARPAQAAPWDP